jgi:ribosome recycling factor
MNQTIDQTKAKMTAVLDHLKEELKSIRTGRANPSMIDSVLVEAYGGQMRIKELASVTVPESRQLLITPFDPNTKGMIAKSIEKANLGFMPNVDGNVIRIRIPEMDGNQRKGMVDRTHKLREEAKVGIRLVRRDSNESARKKKGDSLITEDEMKRLEKQIQDLTDKFCKEADDLSEKKEKEISAI